jgi:hypothetical protein
MTISVVQSTYFAFDTAGNFSNDVAPGNSVILVPALYAPPGTSGSFSTSNPQFGGVGDSVPGTELVAGTGPEQSPGYGYTALWLLPSVADGATFVRMDHTTPVSGGPLGMFAYEVAGLGPAPQLDPAGGVASAIGNDASPDSGGCPAIAEAPELIVGYGHIYAVTLNPPPGAWTTMIGGGVQNFWCGYQLAGATGFTFDWSQTADSDGSWGAAVTAICAQPVPAEPGSGLLLGSFP